MKQLNIIILLIFLVLAANASESEPIQQTISEKHEHLAYNIKVGGVHIADFVVNYYDNGLQYKTSMRVSPHGLANLLGDIIFKVNSEGNILTEKGYPVHKPSQYHRIWANESFMSEQTIIYSKDGRIPKANETIADLSQNKNIQYHELPWVAKRQKRDVQIPTSSILINSVDPITAFFRARSYLLDNNESNFTIKVFDGRRRFNITSEIQEQRVFWINRKDTILQPVVSTIVPIQGYDKKTQEILSEVSLLVLFSTDGSFIPIQSIIQTPSVAGVINLVADCKTNTKVCTSIEKESTSH